MNHVNRDKDQNRNILNIDILGTSDFNMAYVERFKCFLRGKGPITEIPITTGSISPVVPRILWTEVIDHAITFIFSKKK